MSYDLLRAGLDAPICLTWEVTYACNLRCRHCLSSSGKPAPGELGTAAAKQFIDELSELQVFYINVGGGEPLVREDFTELVDHAVQRRVGVKFSTNGTLLDEAIADWIVASEYIDVQVSLDGADPATNDAIRGRGSYHRARQAMARLAARGFRFKINMVLTRHNFDQLDAMYSMANGYGAELRVSRFRPSGRGARVWSDLHPTLQQSRSLYGWLREHPDVATGDSFFHLSALGEPLPGMNLCGAGRIVCLVDPTGDVYACPFLLDDRFKAGNIVTAGSFANVWRTSSLFAHLREWEVQGMCQRCGSFGTCHGGCMAVKHFTGIPLDDPDPECVLGNGAVAAETSDLGLTELPIVVG
jgi:mycofactocin biosynthetic radical S-adenosylmethionine protein MftC